MKPESAAKMKYGVWGIILWGGTLRQARTALWRPSRHGGLTPHSMQPARKGLVMKKILSLAFVAMLSLALAALFVA